MSYICIYIYMYIYIYVYVYIYIYLKRSYTWSRPAAISHGPSILTPDTSSWNMDNIHRCTLNMQDLSWFMRRFPCTFCAKISNCLVQDSFIGPIATLKKLQVPATLHADARLRLCVLGSQLRLSGHGWAGSDAPRLQMPMEGNLRGMEVPQMMPMSASYQSPIQWPAAQMPGAPWQVTRLKLKSCSMGAPWPVLQARLSANRFCCVGILTVITQASSRAVGLGENMIHHDTPFHWVIIIFRSLW